MSKIDYNQITNTVVKNLLKQAEKSGIKITQVDPEFLTFCLQYKGKRHYFFHKKIGLNPQNSSIVSNKYLTLKILDKAGLKVPQAFLAENYEQVLKLIKNKKINYPFVIKPFDYSLGVAVTPNIQDKHTIKMAISRIKLYWKKAKLWGRKKRKKVFMAEEHVNGNDYRILVINKKVAAVTQRAYPEIIGDGKSTVKELIKRYYNNHSYYIKKKRKPLFDQELKRNLKIQNIEMNDVLDKNNIVRLRQTANVFGGGITINVTDKIHPSYKKIAVKAAQEFKMNIAGIDLMTKDISKKDDYRIIEINSFPALDMHEHPDIGKPINVSKLILKSIFPKLK